MRQIVSPFMAFATLALAGPAIAEGDPHMSVGKLVGDFTLHYYGTLQDGSQCPPSPNLLTYAIEEHGQFTYVHSVGLNSSTDPAMATLFAKGSYCRLDFSGEVVLRMHHGTAAVVLPDSVSGRQPDSSSDTDGEPDFSGKFSISYQPIMCLVPPCPPGAYEIVDEAGNAIARVGALLIETQDGSVMEVAGSYLDFESAEGRIRLDNGGMVARVRIERYAD